ncbi:hypothetical protein [Devosia riboflavina]|nr:hypothetical protein [Devosia riboflavina]
MAPRSMFYCANIHVHPQEPFASGARCHCDHPANPMPHSNNPEA